jgi:hypothetical protein
VSAPVKAKTGEPGEWEAVDAGPGSGVQCGCCYYTVRHYWVHRQAHGIRCLQCAPVDDPYRAWLRTEGMPVPPAWGELLRVVKQDDGKARPAPVGFVGRVSSRGTSPQGPWVALQSESETWPRSGAPVTYLVRVVCCERVGGGR